MILVDYLLIKKRNNDSQRLCDVALGLAENGGVKIDEVVGGWFLGRADGAKCSRIVLTDKADNEFLLMVNLGSAEEEEELKEFLDHCNEVRLEALRETPGTPNRTLVPIRVYESEMASIRDQAAAAMSGNVG